MTEPVAAMIAPDTAELVVVCKDGSVFTRPVEQGAEGSEGAWTELPPVPRSRRQKQSDRPSTS